MSTIPKEAATRRAAEHDAMVAALELVREIAIRPDWVPRWIAEKVKIITEREQNNEARRST